MQKFYAYFLRLYNQPMRGKIRADSLEDALTKLKLQYPAGHGYRSYCVFNPDHS